MTIQTTMNPPEDVVLERLVHEVWSTIFILGDAPMAREARDSEPGISAWIRLTSPEEHWLVWIDCNEGLVRQTAALIFGGDPEIVTWYQMKETLAEMINIVGGNLKGLVPFLSGMSLPSTGSKPGEGPTFVGAQALAKVRVGFRGGRIDLNVLRAQAAVA